MRGADAPQRAFGHVEQLRRRQTGFSRDQDRADARASAGLNAP